MRGVVQKWFGTVETDDPASPLFSLFFSLLARFLSPPSFNVPLA